jgi:hypothetical protein
MNYKDPSEIQMENGRTMADYMRRGPFGLRGVVVAKATAGGTPVNYDPHDMSKVRINIVDPNGKSTSDVSIGDFTSSRVNAALEKANEKVPGDDIDSVRERAAMVFEELAKMTKSGVQRVPAKKTNAVVAPPPVDEDDSIEVDIVDELQEEINQHPAPPPVPGPPIDKIDRTYSPMAAFGLKKKTPGPAQNVTASATHAARVGPPQKLVYFEKEGIGTVPAFFHDVIVSLTPTDEYGLEETGFVVLVYDLRFEQSAARWFPPANDPYQRPWAAQINDDARLYLVHTTGFQYVYDSREYCVLTVERAITSTGIE